MNFEIPQQINKIIKKLEYAGFEAYMVGGCVRDILMGLTPHDYDITTSALPHQIKELFEKTVDTGIKHGTVTVIFDNMPVEITTYRCESGYSDNRRPDKVNFVSDLSEDLSRRDFTVNAICYNEKEGFKDLFGGIEDIKNKTLKAVGEAEIRFNEDALRILRLFRFSSVLGFDIEKITFEAAINTISLIKNISCERIAEELKKASLGNNIKALELFINSKGLIHLGVENCRDLSPITQLDKKSELRLFALLSLCDCDKIKVAKNLKLSNKMLEYISILDRLISSQFPVSKEQIKQMLGFCECEQFCDYLEYLEKIKNINCHNTRILLKEILDNNEPYKISHLNISGDDVLALGFSHKAVGDALKFLLSEVIVNPATNEKSGLIKKLKDYSN
ncbi:MAG: CCA tRNA nucleotidyltransferase [Clostridia bacterium]|nr:CCA tRNA nucleotidyltransferase [Clostridia bacterium]